MIDEIGSAIAGYISGGKYTGWKSAAAASIGLGILFFLFNLIKEKILSPAGPWSLEDYLVLTFFSSAVAILCFFILLLAMRLQKKDAKPTEQ